jgi:pyruvate/2-oxoglutarate dehydrogenase complex dihydrolipoamide dehydrogenase (E3) component
MPTIDAATYDVIVIGAGPAGENVADRAVQDGLTVRANAGSEIAMRPIYL